MSNSKTFLIINAISNKNNMSDVTLYLKSIMDVFGKNGGKPIARYKTIEKLVGDESPEMIAIVEFSSTERIKKMLNGKDFKSLADLRASAFTKLNIVICNEM